MVATVHNVTTHQEPSMRHHLIAAAAALALAFPAFAALQARDINTDGQVDAYYDTELDMTWLADANAMGTITDWQGAVTWVSQLDIHGVTGWRLPEVRPGGLSELNHLYSVTLGNNGGLTNTGPFLNVGPHQYMTGTVVPDPVYNNVWAVYFATGELALTMMESWDHAWAVRSGDVLARGAEGLAGVAAPVPEPETYALMLAGLALILGRRWARSR